MNEDISFFLLITGVALALGFDFVNGFHDAANSIATIVSTRVLTPLVAVFWAAFFNFIAIVIFAPRVADTISKIVKIEAHDDNYTYVIISGLIAAIVWDLITWRLGLPTSSSHSIIGGLSGAGIAYEGIQILRLDLLSSTFAFIILAPLIGFLLGLCAMFCLYFLCRNWMPLTVMKTFSKWQLFSAALYSIGHGGNDAQKTMGIIVALLVAAGQLDSGIQISLTNIETAWIILSCQLAMAIGTAFGGWRIIKTMGMKIVKLKPIGGFCAETGGALTLFLATYLGIPVSTTQTITGSIVGVGTISTALSRIKWKTAINVFWAWILTIPASGVLAAIFFKILTRFLGAGNND